MAAPLSSRPVRARRALFALCLAPCLGLAAPAAAQQDGDAAAPDPVEIPLEQVTGAYQAGDHATARAGLPAHAEAGDAVSQYRLGWMMAHGEGGPVDRQGAIRWLEAALAQDYEAARVLLARTYLSENPELPDYDRAAELLAPAVEEGDATAHYLLGQLYRTGRGVAGDKERGFELLRAAAGAGHASAQFAVAQMYSRGEGIERDPAQASRWLLSAAESGHAEAQLSLYFNYSRGTGFPEDPEKAAAWLAEAAKNGSPLGMRIRGTELLLGQGEGGSDPETGLAMLRAAADLGDPAAQSNLGFAYAKGIGVEADDATALDWYRQAADQGLTRAALALATMIETGRGTDPDTAEAIKYYTIAYWGRDRDAAARLGELFVTGAFEAGSEPEGAVDWIAEAAARGHPEALSELRKRAALGTAFAWRRLGEMYRDGTGVEADPAEAATAFLRAARRGDIVGQEAIAEAYATGAGVEQDFVEAHAWANVAATNGSAAAAERRDVLNDLLTPDQLALAQDRARAYLDAD